MVVLTIIAPSSEHTVYFKEPIPKPSYIRLLSASLYNSWLNLKKRGEISWFTDDKKEATVMILPHGHYNLKMAKELQDVFKKEEAKLQTETNTPVSGMVIYKNYMNEVKLDRDLSHLLGISPKLLFCTYVKRLTSSSTYFIHCDLVDKEQNLLNGKPSTVFATFNVRGDPFEKVHYQTA